jgi:hypothetical protein
MLNQSAVGQSSVLAGRIHCTACGVCADTMAAKVSLTTPAVRNCFKAGQVSERLKLHID